MQPTSLYDALAAAISPFSKDGRVPLNKAVKAATEASEVFHAGLVSRNLDLLVRLARAETQVADTLEAANSMQSMAAQKLTACRETEDQRSATQASVVGNLLARIAAFEHLFAVASARWDHEGGPSVVREALEACRVNP